MGSFESCQHNRGITHDTPFYQIEKTPGITQRCLDHTDGCQIRGVACSVPVVDITITLLRAPQLLVFVAGGFDFFSQRDIVADEDRNNPERRDQAVKGHNEQEKVIGTMYADGNP